MMLIDGKDQTYFIDRDNCVFQVDNITFLHRKMPNKHIANTLLDGVSLRVQAGDWELRSLLFQVPNLAMFRFLLLVDRAPIIPPFKQGL